MTKNLNPKWVMHVSWQFTAKGLPPKDTSQASWTYCDLCANKVLDFLDQIEMPIDKGFK